jgi:gluconate 2-dehydrogenase gamma chain
MVDQPARQTAMRGGLAWIDRECLVRHDAPFLACPAAAQAALLDDISWPQRTQPALSHGTAFFTSFRDLTASGFWTSKMGIKDLQYNGNVFVPEWKGCPDDVLKKLGVG